ncbi:antitoxin of the YoeB-YefM toxin-antitoxin system [Vibrio coralliirubri]|nr:antitoxin of the YoeB-YefM toxin-antitoxin system [Vibrio coralliirubri]
MMNIVSFTEARNSLKSVLDRVVDDSDVTVITRRDSEDAVVMSLDHFNSMQETLYLMSSPKNAERLAESIAQLEAGNTTVRELNNDE